jgi:uncharacterized phage-associated protein
MATVHDVVAAIIDRLGPVDPMKLQKLLFYAQGWSLAWRGALMFPENVEAWEWGPVVEDVYQTYKDHEAKPIKKAKGGNPNALTADERQTLAAVLDTYGGLSGPELAHTTHDNEAWAAAYARRTAPHRSRQVIREDELVRALRRGQAEDTPGPDVRAALQGWIDSIPGVTVKAC